MEQTPFYKSEEGRRTREAGDQANRDNVVKNQLMQKCEPRYSEEWQVLAKAFRNGQ